MKKNCVEIKKINGNISKSNDGELRSETYIGKKDFTFIFLKNSISVNMFKITTKLKNTSVTKIKDFKKLIIIYLT